MNEVAAIEICSVVHLVRPTHREVSDVEGLARGIAEVEPASLFYHVVQPPLRAPASTDLPPDDFSAWVTGVLQDRETAERLSLAAQRAGAGPELLRTALIQALDGRRPTPRAPEGGEFSFLAADTVVVPIADSFDPDVAMVAIAHADASAWFYHLIEQPWFSGGAVPLANALRTAGALRLAERLEQMACAGFPLEKLRRDAIRMYRRLRLGSRVAAAAAASEMERSEEARDAAARLARRLVRGGRS
jgi:hypothetical protein